MSFDAVRTWVDAALRGLGKERTGELELFRERPWGTVVHAETTGGRVWMKACGAATAFEPGLYELLVEVVPQRVLEPLAVDVDRAWLLLPDGGPRLGDALEGEQLVEAMTAILPRYAEMQLALAPHLDRALAAGVHDLRPARIGERFDQALAAARAYAERDGTDSERATCARIAEMREPVSEWGVRLAEMPGAASLDHNDLHPWNVLVQPGDELARPRFYDWGDAVIAHPFASMLVPLRFVEGAAPPGDRRPLRRACDAYLEPFAGLAPHAELIDALELACEAAKVARALTWVRAIGDEELTGEHTRWAGAPLASLAALLDPSYLANG